MMKTCHECRKPATREVRLTDDGKLDMHMPFKPVCDDCNPWNAIYALDYLEGEVWREVQQKASEPRCVAAVELWYEYADKLCRQLSDSEKIDAVMTSVRLGWRVEPFSTLVDMARHMGDVELKLLIKLLEQER